MGNERRFRTWLVSVQNKRERKKHLKTNSLGGQGKEGRKEGKEELRRRRKMMKALSLQNSVCQPDPRLTKESLCLCTSVSVLTRDCLCLGVRRSSLTLCLFFSPFSFVSALCYLFLFFSSFLKNGQTRTHANMTNILSSFLSCLPLPVVPLFAPSHSLLFSFLALIIHGRCSCQVSTQAVLHGVSCQCKLVVL